MRWYFGSILLFSCVVSLTHINCTPPQPPPSCESKDVSFTAQENQKILNLSSLPSLPKNPTNAYADNAQAAHLGQFLFYDKRLSNVGTTKGKVSCATCHSPEKGWSDQKTLSQGVATLTRHSPTLWNVAYNRWQFWDGRADTLWAQAVQPIEDSKEMASSRFRTLYLFVKEDTKLKQAYESIFGPLPSQIVEKYKNFKDAKPIPSDTSHPMHVNWESIALEDQKKINRFYSNIGKSLEAYQRKIISKDSKFDEFAAGLKTCNPTKIKAISASAKRGLKIFIRKDACISCHDGPNFSDSEFHNIGLPRIASRVPDVGRLNGLDPVLKDLFNGVGPFSDASPDAPINERIRFLRKNNTNTIGEFKTPTLRSVSTSAPYMHDGRFKDLDAVLRFYSHFGAKDTTGCIKDGRAGYIPPKTDPNARVQDPKKCKLDEAQVGLREETMLLLLLTEQQRKDVIAFLHTLTGKELPSTLLKAPSSPILPK